MKINITKAKEAFKEYVKNYDPEEGRVKVKISHIERVANLARKMAEELNLSEEDIQLAELIGLLHDIGRFEQIRLYHTFVDRKSVNHGELGAKILFEDGLIINLKETETKAHFNLETDEFDEIIKIAIINHNRGRIEDGLTERQLLHAKLVRDADKTDIFYILLTGDEKIAWETDNMNNETITDEIFREFMEDKHIDYKNIKTGGDSLVSHFAYIYDLYFKPAFKIFKERNYVEKLYNRFDFTNKDTAEKFRIIEEKVKQYIEEKG